MKWIKKYFSIIKAINKLLPIDEEADRRIQELMNSKSSKKTRKLTRKVKDND